MNNVRCNSRGFTLVELLVVIAVIGILLGLLLPAHRGAREAARRMACSNNFKQIGLSLHNYHSAYKHLPAGIGGTVGMSARDGNASRLSGIVALLPFLEQQHLWEQISNESNFEGVAYPPMGAAPWVAEYEPWRNEIPTLRCPSSPSEPKGYGLTSYALSIGDAARRIHEPDEARGVFAFWQTLRFKDILDGLSNTIAMGEIRNATDRNANGQFATNQPVTLLDNPEQCKTLTDPDRPNFFIDGLPIGKLGRGGCWADGGAGHGLTNMIIPPNRPSLSIAGPAADGLYSTSSFHQGGAHVLLGDGAVIFITDSVESGDQNSPPYDSTAEAPIVASPYGLWGALGTIASMEEIEEQMNQ